METDRCEILLIGGRSGVGKSTIGWEVSAQLQDRSVAHCLIEGDMLDQAYPAPQDDPARTRLTENNLAALWRNYAALGHRRLIYTNTVSVLESEMIARATGGSPLIIAVLLTSSDAVARERLSAREIGSQRDAHILRSNAMALRLDQSAPSWIRRLRTDSRGVVSIARDIVSITGW